jgi:hypothetical protein
MQKTRIHLPRNKFSRANLILYYLMIITEKAAFTERTLFDNQGNMLKWLKDNGLEKLQVKVMPYDNPLYSRSQFSGNLLSQTLGISSPTISRVHTNGRFYYALNPDILIRIGQAIKFHNFSGPYTKILDTLINYVRPDDHAIIMDIVRKNRHGKASLEGISEKQSEKILDKILGSKTELFGDNTIGYKLFVKRND